MHRATNIIRSEHRALAAVIHGLQYLVGEIRRGGPQPNFKVLRAMLHYIDTFPEKLHHPKEDRYLFQKLYARSPEAHPVVAGLEAQHTEGAQLIRKLEQALLRWEVGGDASFAAFASQVDHYAAFHWRHMQQEEHVVLPLAERVLTDEDWAEIDAAFAGHLDLLVGRELHQDFDALFKQIVSLAPPPIGVGPDSRGGNP